MKREQETKLFEATRELPTELSLTEVQQIITILPTLPLDQSWIHSLFTKSFIMSTVSITLISTVIFLFFPEEQATTALVIQEEESPTLVIESEELPFPEITQNIPATTTKEITASEDEIENQEPFATSEAVLDSIPEIIFNTSTTDEAPSLFLSSKSSDDIIASENEGTWLDQAEYNLSIADTTPILGLNGEIDLEGKQSAYRDMPIGKVKRELFRKLKKDNFISSKKELAILKLGEDAILINNQSLSPQQEKSYADWLDKYNIRRGPEHQIRICSDYIMIGDFDAGDHFRGRARGKNMILKFKEDQEGGLFGQEK